MSKRKNYSNKDKKEKEVIEKVNAEIIENPEPEVNQVIEEIVIEPEEKKIFCKYAIPIYANTDETDHAFMSFLCRDSDDNLFILNKAYNAPNEEDKLAYECLPFAEYETDHISRKLEYKWLISYLPRYTTTLNFFVDDDFRKNENPKVYINGIKRGESEKTKIEMNLDIFASLLFLDTYPASDCESDHDLDLATINGALDHPDPCKFFVVDNLEILSIVEAKVEPEKPTFMDKIKSIFSKEEEVPNTNIAMVLKLESSSGDEKETLQLLISFDIGVELNKEKFRGKTVSNIEKEYFVDKDQYVSTLMVPDTKLHGVDKTYMVIRAVNKDKNSIIILLDTIQQQSINNKINGYWKSYFGVNFLQLICNKCLRVWTTLRQMFSRFLTDKKYLYKEKGADPC